MALESSIETIEEMIKDILMDFKCIEKSWKIKRILIYVLIVFVQKLNEN